MAAAAAAAFGQGYIHKMLVFNLAPLIVSAGGDLSGGNTHTHAHTHLSPFHTHSFSFTHSPLRYLCRFSGFVMALPGLVRGALCFSAWQIRFPCCEIAIQNAFSPAMGRKTLEWQGKGAKLFGFLLKCGM